MNDRSELLASSLWLVALLVMAVSLSFSGINHVSLHAETSPAAAVPGGAPKATGYFHAHKEADGRWWIIAPDGSRFISKGVCNVTYWQDKIQGTDHSPYLEANKAKYGSIDAFRKAAGARLLGWNFNSLGAWADSAISAVEVNGLRLARSPILDLGSSFVAEKNKAHPERGHAWLHGTFPDVFDADFEPFMRREAMEKCAPHAKDPYVLGWFTDNELRWGPDWRKNQELLVDFLNAPADTAGRKAAAAFLEKRYTSIEEFNSIWKTSLKAWPELATAAELKTPYPVKAVYQQNKDTEEKLNAAESGRIRYVADCNAFTAILAEKYFKGTTEAIRAAAPHHMVFGCRFAYVPIQPVVDAASHTLDVISFNAYAHDPTGTINRYAVFGKPLIIGEFAFRAEDSGLPNTKGAGPKVKNQAERAAAYRVYVQKAMEHPQMVGYHWFEHADEPKEGRFDGENSNYGVVNIKDEPYEEFVKVAREVNAQAEAWHGGQKAALPADK
ncbi:MAG: agarase [Candidatus Methylacidiphilales bacterium]|nr:hypothetical protein [Candidatus Methylacidiphilales bacterium]